MATIRIVVSKLAAHPRASEGSSVQNPDLHELASRLRARGMKIDTVMEAIGIITGEVAERDLPALQSFPGVTVEREDSVQLNPPDAPVQ